MDALLRSGSFSYSLALALALTVSPAPGRRVGFCLFLPPSYTGHELIMTEAAAVVPS